MKRFWEKEKVMIKERTFSMLLAMGENEYNIICVERFMHRRGRPEENIPHEYQTKVVYRIKENDIAVKPGMLPRITAGYDFELTDEQHEKLIEEISKGIKCIVIGK